MPTMEGNIQFISVFQIFAAKQFGHVNFLTDMFAKIPKHKFF